MSENKEYISRPDEMGTIHISEDVLAVIAAAAALDVEGVGSLAGNLGTDLAQLLGKKNAAKGVKIGMDEGAVVVELSLLIKYGYTIMDVAKEVQEAVKNAVEAMVSAFGCKPENICAAIGPNIGGCCFETDNDVPEAIVSALGDEAKAFISQKGHKFHLDLKQINALWLRRSGVSNISISGHCTACRPDLFWSHRVTKGERGSQGAIILCKEGR